MAAGTDYLQALSMLDGSYRKENVTVTRDGKSSTFENLKQPNIGRPPRHLSAIRCCVSSAQLSPAAEVELDVGIVSSKSPSDSNSAFVPVFRSGSCSEIGPKPYMEDEYVCIDNILDHLRATANFTSPGAFYEYFHGCTTPGINIEACNMVNLTSYSVRRMY
ncbi:probable protein phosphatase 2C 27 [Pyrus x bretschneideri]|uniref:probable protein phosphatase 2C 27 n=1 Tax=Pyrus x bretschneideri TaxID=225117 RepID=UPI00202EA4FB|nr:probable protein phosphatase 2C 27 [Pyrus x bretschneideri]